MTGRRARRDDHLYEHACHEGNYEVLNALSGQRDSDELTVSIQG